MVISFASWFGLEHPLFRDGLANIGCIGRSIKERRFGTNGGPKARSIPAWGQRPMSSDQKTLGANGADHYVAGGNDGPMEDFHRPDGTGLQAS
jgi:hypothetical protein